MNAPTWHWPKRLVGEGMKCEHKNTKACKVGWTSHHGNIYGKKCQDCQGVYY